MGTQFEISHSTGTVNFKEKGTSNLVLEKGASSPGSGVEGHIFWRTDTKQPLVHDGIDYKAVLGGSFRVYNETPAGTVNSVNTVFTVVNPYVTGTTIVSRDGLIMKPGGVDYTETLPATGTITFTTAPTTGSTILVSYSRVEGSSLPLMNKFDVIVGTVKQTYTGSTTVFDFPFAYTVGVGSLLVWSAGVLMLVGATSDYQETGAAQITFNSARTGGEVIQFIKIGATNDQVTSGWIDGGTYVAVQTNTDQVRIGDGTAGTPGLAFSSTTDTGFYYSTGLNFATSGTQRVKITTAGSFQTFGAVEQKLNTITSASYAPAQESIILANATSNAITVNLPAAAGATGRIYNIKKIDSSANTVTIDANASETIDGVLTYVETTQYESITIVCDGSNWFII